MTVAETAEDMLFDLLGNRLEVVLIPAPVQRHSGHSIRAVQYANPLWYQKFCAEFTTTRKRGRIETKIKRRETITAFKKIIKEETKGIYVERILDFMEKEKEKATRSVAIENIYDESNANKILYF